MDILTKAGANLSSCRYTELEAQLQGFIEQKDMIHKESLRAKISTKLEIKRKNWEEIHNVLVSIVWKCSNVDTLHQICRLKIRSILKFSFRERLEALCLPGRLYDYILM